MKLTPLADRILLKPLEALETTKSGIIISTATKEKSAFSEVVAVGPGGMVDGVEVTMTVKPGMKVVSAKYSGTEVKIDDQDYTLVKQSDILAIVED
ncbi:MAG: co-chaperone GroES [Oscillospiraceae bacterium]|nr:co-chaperone GroES [Oscillospiraceae bacterium]